MFPMDRKPLPVCIEFTSRNQRVVRTFPNEHAAKQFFVSKDRAGKRPTVTTNQQGNSTMATKTKTAPKKTEKKETVRTRALRAIAKGGDMTASAVQEVIKLGHNLKPTLDQEVERGHLVAVDQEGRSAYRVTAVGKKALAANSVDPTRSKATTKKPTKATKKSGDV
jgi:hypothetical protein